MRVWLGLKWWNVKLVCFSSRLFALQGAGHVAAQKTQEAAAVTQDAAQRTAEQVRTLSCL